MISRRGVSKIGLFLGPLLFLITLLIPADDLNGLSFEARRGEVYRQEQQRIAEESKQVSPEASCKPKNRGEVYRQEQQRIAEESKQVEAE